MDLPPESWLPASIWSLLLPAIDRSDHLGHLAFLPAAGGFLSGTLLLLLLDHALTQVRPDASRKNIHDDFYHYPP